MTDGQWRKSDRDESGSFPPRAARATLLALAFAAAGCAHRAATPVAPEVVPTATVEATPELIAAVHEHLDRADNLLRLGIQMVEADDLPAALVAFDASMEALLTIPGGARVTPESAAAFDHMLEKIQTFERRAIAALELRRADELASLEVPAAAPPELEEPPEGWDFPAERNAQVERAITSFTGREREWFAVALSRSGLYLDHIHETFDELGIPRELAWLALVESAFKPRAYSRARARGVWQFISSTGRRYGLHQDFWVDERSDPSKATHAAGRYLRDLHELLGDWNLAMAAYNGGEGKVQRAIRRYGTRDFWRLARTRGLARETRNYVPRVHAAILIAREPERYGFGNVKRQPALLTERVTLDGPVDLRVIGECLGRPVKEVKRLNPELRRIITPMSGDYALHVPIGASGKVSECVAAMPEKMRARYVTHVVKSGDTLSEIAARYGSRVSIIASANGRRVNQTLRIGTPLVIPVLEAPARTARARPKPTPTPSGKVRVDYRIRQGDTLSTIAEQHGTTVRNLKSWNGLRSSRIRAGKQLTIYTEPN